MGGWGGGGYGCVRGCLMHAHMHMHAHTCTHEFTCMLNMLNMLNMDASMLAAICNFYTCIHVCAYMFMHAHAYGDTHPCLQTPSTHLPPPQSHRVQGSYKGCEAGMR